MTFQFNTHPGDVGRIFHFRSGGVKEDEGPKTKKGVIGGCVLSQSDFRHHPEPNGDAFYPTAPLLP